MMLSTLRHRLGCTVATNSVRWRVWKSSASSNSPWKRALSAGAWGLTGSDSVSSQESTIAAVPTDVAGSR